MAQEHLRLIAGAPDEPDTGDWHAIGAAPGIEDFFALLFWEVAAFALPEAVIASESDDGVRHIRVGWRGTPTLGAEVTVMDCPESSDFPVYCDWVTHGLPGMAVTWSYALEYAGQLGHVAYRHRELACWFDAPADRERFAALWRRHIAKTPVFARADAGA